MKRIIVNKKYLFIEYKNDLVSLDDLASDILSKIDSIYGISESGDSLLRYSPGSYFNNLTSFEKNKKYLIVSKQEQPNYVLYETTDCSEDVIQSIVIDKNISIVKYCGNNNVLLTDLSFLNKINKIYSTNTDGSSFIAYRKNSLVNSLTSLRPNKYYLVFSDASASNPFLFCKEDGFNTANYNNCAVWNGVIGNVTTVGSNGNPSSYGCYDIDGNVSEWTDAIESNLAKRAYRGGNYSSNSSSLNVRTVVYPEYASNFLGFRICSAYIAPTPTPTITPTNTITPTVTPTSTVTPTNTVTPTLSVTPTTTVTPTNTNTPTSSVTPTNTTTPTTSVTPTLTSVNVLISIAGDTIVSQDGNSISILPT